MTIQHWPTYQEMDEGRPRGRVVLSPMMIHGALDLLDDVQVVAFETSVDPLQVIVVIETPRLRIVAPGCQAPNLVIVPTWRPRVALGLEVTQAVLPLDLSGNL